MSERSRRKRKSQQTVASNIHYVGYVEDEESVEAIMKKFEELERIQQEFATQPSAPEEDKENTPVTPATKDKDKDVDMETQEQQGGLSEAQLQEIFKRTSAFTVKSATMAVDGDDDDLEFWQLELNDGNTEEWLEEDDYIAVDDDFWDQEFGDGRSRRERKRGRLDRPVRRGMVDREAIIAKYKIMQVRIQDRDGNYFLVKKKVSTLDPSLPTYIKIPPPPIPQSWVHAIPPYKAYKPTPQGSRYLETDDLLGCNLSDRFGNDFQAIYLDPPLLLPGEEPSPGKMSVQDLGKLAIPDLITKGFLFIWLEKELLPDIVRIADNWGFKYVENFCWIKQRVNNAIAQIPYRYFRKSKLTCLIFRKEGDVELRHQRNPDCVFDFIKPKMDGDLTEGKPSFIYDVIETMLPQAVYSPENPNGERLLELWAKKGTQRTGWTTVVQTSPSMQH